MTPRVTKEFQGIFNYNHLPKLNDFPSFVKEFVGELDKAFRNEVFVKFRIFHGHESGQLVEEVGIIAQSNISLDFFADLWQISRYSDIYPGSIVEIHGQFVLLLLDRKFHIMDENFFDYYSVLTTEERIQILNDLLKRGDDNGCFGR